MEVIVNNGNNIANRYSSIVAALKEIAEKENINLEDVITLFIEDLENNSKEDYEPKIVDLSLVGFKEKSLNDLKRYLIKIVKTKKDINKKEKMKSDRKSKKAEQAEELEKVEEKWSELKENIEAQMSKSKEGSSIEIIEKNLNSITEKGYSIKEVRYFSSKLSDWIRKEKEAQQMIDKVMIEIEEMCKANDNVEPLEFWKSTKQLVGNRKELNDIAKQKVLKEIDTKIKEHEDILYYEQVKAFTGGFEFLAEEPEVIKATSNGIKIKKFTDKNSYDRFDNLRSKLRNSYLEENQRIQQLLSNKNLNNADRRILTERKQVLDKQKQAQIEER